jgi:hypothetical protein
MNTSKNDTTCLRLFQALVAQIGKPLKTTAQKYLLPLLTGIVLATAPRRTVTKWLTAAKISEQYRQVFYTLPIIGQKNDDLFDAALEQILQQLTPFIVTETYIRIVIDDSPTKRYGKKIEGAGWHHNPTPGKTDAEYCYGHSWVVATLVIAHPLFGEVSFPIASSLYLRKNEIKKLAKKYHRKFETKTEMAVKIMQRLVPKLKVFGKQIEVIVDGGYAKDSVLVPLGEMEEVVTITRFRQDAALFEMPKQPKKPGKGRPKKYGDQIDVRKKVETNFGWKTIECRQYGKTVRKKYKTFVAVSRITKGKPIRVVLVKEENDVWVPLISTDVKMEVKEILEAYSVRFGIEETFKDLKEVYGWGKQEVRNLETNEAVTAMNMLVYNLVELTTWAVPKDELVDRSFCPWDDVERRPSHADRRKYLRYTILEKIFFESLTSKNINPKIIETLKFLVLNA